MPPAPDFRAAKKRTAIVTAETDWKPLADRLDRLIALIERAVPPARPPLDVDVADAFVWHAASGTLLPVRKVNRVDLALLRGVDRVRDMLAENTERFARGLPANNALLWGARGMGKSSLVKAVLNEFCQRGLRLIDHVDGLALEELQRLVGQPISA